MAAKPDVARIRPGVAGPARAAFSLLEILLVIGVIGVLTGIFMPALRACRMAGRNLKCVTQMKQVSFDFRLFSDDFAFRNRGDGGKLPPADSPLFNFDQRTFYLEDFQESLYGIHEYWDAPSLLRATYDAPRTTLMCPEGPSLLRRRANAPCSAGAVFPRENVSIAFNRRLHRPSLAEAPRPLTSKVLDYPDVPLAVDVDGAQATARTGEPYYLTPPLPDADDGYADGRYWSPSWRHGGRLNVSFVGGHVLSVNDPVASPDFRWSCPP
jgi:prepilin-type processing-associated H-X9-DG protein